MKSPFFIPDPKRIGRAKPVSQSVWQAHQDKVADEARSPDLKARESQMEAEDKLQLHQAQMGLLDQEMSAAERIAGERAQFAATRGSPQGVNRRNSRDHISKGAFSSIGRLEQANLGKQSKMLGETSEILKARRKSLFGSAIGFRTVIDSPEHIRSLELASIR